MDASQPRRPLIPRNRYILAIALATFAVAFLEAIGAIELPLGSLFSAISGSLFSSSSGQFMRSYGYASLFGLMALESASLPVPSEVVLPFAGYLVSTGVMNFWVAVAVSTAAGIFGALVDYYLARWLGRPFVVGLLDVFGLHRGALDRAEGWFQRWGQWTVFVARFVPGLRTVISLPAGLFEMRLRPFVLMTLAGCLLWNVILIYAGLVAGTATTAFNSSAAIDGVSAILAITAGGYIAYYAASLFRRPPAVSPSSVS